MVHTCTLCDRFFKSLGGLNIHQAQCKFKQVIINKTNQDVITEDVYVSENILVETSTVIESEEIDIKIEVELKLNLPPHTNKSSIVKSTTNSLNGHEFVETIHRVYDEIVQWRRNLFKLPPENAAKMFIREITSCLEHFNRDSEYKYIALKVYMILLSLLLQKPTRNTKVKDHTKRLEERLSTWKGDRIRDLVSEGRIIQECIRSSCQ